MTRILATALCATALLAGCTNVEDGDNGALTADQQNEATAPLRAIDELWTDRTPEQRASLCLLFRTDPDAVGEELLAAESPNAALAVLDLLERKCR